MNPIAQRPVRGNGKHDHRALAESFPELKHVGHALERVINTSHQGYPLKYVLHLLHESLPDEASAQHPHSDNEQKQQRKSGSRNFKRHHGPQQSPPQSIQRP